MKRSATLRHVGLAYIAFAVIATVAVVGSEILKELGR